MWRFFRRSTDRFSVHHFKYLINELREIRHVDTQNREVVVNLMQSIAEIVTYGDQHDPEIFECVMEFQVLAEFVRILKVRGSLRIQGPVLHYLGIMMQNIENERAIYYCLSNGYINSIIVHEYDFEGGDVLPYYVSFLRAVGGKIDRTTVCLLVEVHKETVVSFPLYEAALKFAHHGEKMIQIAVRALTLKIHSVADEMIYWFLTTPPVSDYFSVLITNLKNKCFDVDVLSIGLEQNCHEKKSEFLLGTDEIVDDLYYLKDILCTPGHCFNKFVTENMNSLLILPMLLNVLLVRQSTDRGLSPVTCLCILSRLLQVFDGTDLVNVVGSALLFTCTSRSTIDNLSLEGVENYFFTYLRAENSDECLSCIPVENTENEWLKGWWSKSKLSRMVSSDSEVILSGWYNKIQSKSSGIFGCVFSSNRRLMLASMMLLFVVVESKDLDHQISETIGFSEVKTASEHEGSILTRQARKMVNKLLKSLYSEPPDSAAMFNTAWFLRKLLVFQNQKLRDDDHHLFKASYELSCKRLREKLDQCWFDCIPDTIRNEWAKCKTVLEESSQSKDPFFVLELASCQVTTRGSEDAADDWKRMIDDVKVFILHLQLKSLICGAEALDNPLANWKSSSSAQSGRRSASDLSLASFGSEVTLGSGFPCKIAFSGGGTRDVYMIPTAREISGKLLLVEQHPLHSRKGVVIAIAPLAGSNPKIDENHPTRLHVQLRDFQSRLHSSERRKIVSSCTIPVTQGRWVLGFVNADACKAAYSRILDETAKLRSSVESLIAPLLEYS